MSRIEKSLERAVEIRESGRDGSPGAETPRPEAIAVSGPGGEPLVKPEAVDGRLVCIKDPCCAAAEQYRKLRASVLKATIGDFLNTIMVTSPGVGEGKSVTAVNLAVTIANEIDHTVLLVDADLRNPSISRYLGLEPRPGLSEYLRGGVRLSDVLVRTGIGKLLLLPAGSPPENPSELLSSARMKTLVKELKNRYRNRYVIFDSLPLLPAADAIPLAGYVDGVLMIVQAARTTPRAASRAISLIKDSRMLGIVFNNVPEQLEKQLSAYARYYHGNGKKAPGVAQSLN